LKRSNKCLKGPMNRFVSAFLFGEYEDSYCPRARKTHLTYHDETPTDLLGELKSMSGIAYGIRQR
jgi:hypothetical protein